MKLLIVFCCILVTAYAVSEEFIKDVKQQMAEAASTCIPSVGANEGDIAEIMAHKHPSRQEGKCLISCFQKHFGLQGEDGQPSKDGILKLIEPINDDDPELYKKLIEIALICGPQVSSMGIADHCDVALEIATCAIREGRKFDVHDPFMIQG